MPSSTKLRRNPRRISRLLCVAAVLALTPVPTPSHAADAESAAARPGAETPPEAAFFRLGPQQLGLSLGYGHGVDFAGSGLIEGHQVRELIILPHWQIAVTREPLRHAWFKGRLLLRAETPIYVNFSPRRGVAGGLGLFLRYELSGGEHLSPYLMAGAGPIGLDFDLADQADGLAFIPQLGFGLVARLDAGWSADLGFRFHHISNAYTSEPNGGIDTLQLLLGLAYAF